MDLTSMTVDKERITIQNVNPKIYNASYPCWMLDKSKIDKIFEKHNYIQVEEFNALGGYKVESGNKKIGEYMGEIRMKV
jgi:hypothetical protein